MEIWYYITFFLFGLCFGSFYNVVGMRIPAHESINKPGSHCPKCSHKLKWYELIPVLSFLIQKGKCRACKAKLSYLYPFTELATAILFTVSYHSFHFSYKLIIALTLCSLLMIVIVSDLTYLIIPDRFIVIPAIIIALVIFVFEGFTRGLIQLGYGVISFLIMYLLMRLGNFLFKKESMGGADIKLMFISGLALDPFLSVVVIFIASFIAFPVSFFLLLRNKEHIIPFGPFITLGILIVFFTKLNIIEIFEKVLTFF